MRSVTPPWWWRPWLRLYRISDWWNRARPVHPYGRRDRIAAAACNWILNHIASERYRAMIGGEVRCGLYGNDRQEEASGE